MSQTFDEFFAATEATESSEPAPEAAPEVDETVEVGQGEVEGTASTPEPTRFDPSQYGDHLVPVKVDGETLEVPLSEALQGYQRQAHFTRSQQALAEEAKRLAPVKELAERLQRDPRGTLAQLAMEQLAATQQQQVEEVPTDPVQRELYEVKRQLAELKQADEEWRVYQETQQLGRALTQLQAEYGSDFDPMEVASRAHAFAEQTGVAPDLRAVFMQMQGERYWAAQAARREDEAQRTAADAAATAAKAEAAQLFGGGSARGGGLPIEAEVTSLKDAIEAALQQHS